MATLSSKKTRSSNLELFRIITMLLIVAHHYLVHSNLMDTVHQTKALTMPNIFLLLFGAWGKTGINCFVLITGYFMCKSDITGKKYFKLLFEVMFYKITIFFIFLLCGKETLSFTSLVNTFLPTTFKATFFTDCFLIFYLLIPFINILIRNLNKKSHITLTAILLFAYTVIGSIPWFEIKFNYISWFLILYLIAALIRIYPCKATEKAALWGLITLACIFISCASILLVYSGKAVIVSSEQPFYFVADSNKILALATSISAFLFFKNIKLPQIKFVNAVGATTYGVLLIHSSSDAMCNWLWNDTLKTSEYYVSGNLYLHAFVSVILVFSVCSFIDFIRIHTIEKVALNIFDKVKLKRTAKQ